MLKHRSLEKELLDLGSNFYTPAEYNQCMKILFKINKFLGFFQDTVKILKKFSANASLVDIGCGGGLFLLNLSKHFPTMQLTGIDISPEAIHIAQQELQNLEPSNTAQNISFAHQPDPSLETHAQLNDIVLATLVCHHLSDDELIPFLQHMFNIAQQAVIINDLHRHPISHFFYKIMSPLLFRNRLITHDGLISIRRGFTRKEWKLLLTKANIHNYQIQWRFPFRWRVILWKM